MASAMDSSSSARVASWEQGRSAGAGQVTYFRDTCLAGLAVDVPVQSCVRVRVQLAEGRMTGKTDVNGAGAQTFAEMLRAAWSGGVRSDYLSGFIGTERALQASLYFHLRVLGGGAWVYVEPRLSVRGQEFMPDLCVLVPEQRECWVIELKLQNAASQGVVWRPDFEKFALIEAAAAAGKPLALRPRGRQRAVPLPASLRYAYVAVGDSSCGALDADWLKAKAGEVLREAAGKTLWLGGITDTEEFLGPLELR